MENYEAIKINKCRGKAVTMVFAILAVVSVSFAYIANFVQYNVKPDLFTIINFVIYYAAYFLFLIYICFFHGKAPALFSITLMLLAFEHVYTAAQKLEYIGHSAGISFVVNVIKIFFDLSIFVFLVVMIVDSFKGLNKKGFVVVVCVLSIVYSFVSACLTVAMISSDFILGANYTLFEDVIYYFGTAIITFFINLYFYIALWIYGVKNTTSRIK